MCGIVGTLRLRPERSSPLDPHIAEEMLSAIREALGMSVFSVLSKPVDFNQLLDVLARVLRRYHQSRWPGGDKTGGPADEGPARV